MVVITIMIKIKIGWLKFGQKTLIEHLDKFNCLRLNDPSISDNIVTLKNRNRTVYELALPFKLSWTFDGEFV